MKQKVWSILGLMFLLLAVGLQLVSAVDFDEDISAEDKATFDEILDPIMKVYNLVKYAASVIAVVVLLFAGITYLTAGGNPGKREQAKNMIMYVVIGLVVIWAAPLIVDFIVG
jgi:type IV secretory pathway VirB2 component (pilin)